MNWDYLSGCSATPLTPAITAPPCWPSVRPVEEVAGMDHQTEPIPLYGHSPEVEVMNLAAYLADLFVRASERTQDELPDLISSVGERLAS